ncbi:MAG: zinc ribbon domain-containing protein [Chloroflexi bacterium]|nr:zinc ribbon domain-containing protein [Chloroflexota bacterium]
MNDSGQTDSEEARPHLFCAYCGTEDASDYGYCDHCGEKVEAPDDIRYGPSDIGRCSACGAKNQLHARHCVECGVLIDDHPLISGPPQADASVRDAAYPDPAVDFPENESDDSPEPDVASQSRPESPSTINRKNKPSMRDLSGDARGAPYRPPLPKPEPPLPGRSDNPNEMLDDLEPNSSGERDAELPPELRGYNWGAALLAPIWGTANKVWFSTVLFALWILPIPPMVGLPLYVIGSAYMGFQGNELAWQAKKWKSAQHFRRIQQNWAFWGFIASPIIMMGIITIPFWLSN